MTQGGLNPQWTTRFTIASATGAVTAAPYTTQPDGELVAWGTGKLGKSSAAANSAASASLSDAASATATDDATPTATGAADAAAATESAGAEATATDGGDASTASKSRCLTQAARMLCADVMSL